MTATLLVCLFLLWTRKRGWDLLMEFRIICTKEVENVWSLVSVVDCALKWFQVLNFVFIFYGISRQSVTDLSMNQLIVWHTINEHKILFHDKRQHVWQRRTSDIKKDRLRYVVVEWWSRQASENVQGSFSDAISSQNGRWCSLCLECHRRKIKLFDQHTPFEQRQHLVACLQIVNEITDRLLSVAVIIKINNIYIGVSNLCQLFILIWNQSHYLFL